MAYDHHTALRRSRVWVEIRPAMLTQAEMDLVGILNPLQLDFQAAWPLPLDLELELSGKALRDAQPWRFSLLLPAGQTALELPDIPAEEASLRLRTRPQGQAQWGEWLEQKLTGSLPLKHFTTLNTAAQLQRLRLKSAPLSQTAADLLREIETASDSKLRYLRWAMYGNNQPQHPVHTLSAQEVERAWEAIKSKPAKPCAMAA